MTVCATLFLFVILKFFHSSDAAYSPLDNWTICPRSSEDMNFCLRGAIQSAVRQLKDGNRKLGVLPMDPLHLELLKIEQKTGPVTVDLSFKNIDITGISGIVVDSAKLPLAGRVDWDGASLSVEAHLEEPRQLVTVGSYEVSGRVLALPITGSGACNLTFDDYGCKIEMRGSTLEREGERFLDIRNFSLEMSTSRLHVSLDNLFNGDKALGDNMNLFLNENWSQILSELGPAVSQAIGEAFKQISNAVFHKIPLSKLAPE